LFSGPSSLAMDQLLCFVLLQVNSSRVNAGHSRA
jgi:hypothetical protein